MSERLNSFVQGPTADGAVEPTIPGDLNAALAESGTAVLAAGESHDVAIDPTRFTQFPEPIRKNLQAVADRAAVYLEKPILTDNFTDQQDRRDWRTKIKQSHAYSPETIAFLEDNRLRLNAVSPLLFKIPGLRTALAAEPQSIETVRLTELLDALLALVAPVPSFEMRYRPMSLDEKIAFTRSFSEAARAYLEYVTSHEPALESAA